VVAVAEEYPHYDAYQSLAERSRELARELLDGQVKKLENLGATIEQSHLRMSSAAAEVVELAEELGAGLVVMGSRGRSEIRRLLMGSVSDSVVGTVVLPILIGFAWAVLGYALWSYASQTVRRPARPAGP
jgi:nucleotide-binding universal stress UspA family protein